VAWPSTTVSTANLDANSDSPLNARPDLLQAVQYLNDIINSRSVASGLAPLDSGGLVPASMIPPQIPAGLLSPFAGATAPTGWLLCYGQAVSRTTYAALWAAIGPQWGNGDGSTTFNLPDMRGRTTAGGDAMGGSAANRITVGGSGIAGASIGNSGGSETHTLTSAQIPAHTHPINGGNSYFLMRTTGGSVGLTSGTGLADTVSNTSSNSGGGAHNNVQPTAIVNYIIKT
jgi:microcystin-dependent protein